MTAPHSRTEAIDTLYTTTWQNRRGAAIDNIYEKVAFLAWMKANGRIFKKVGGRYIAIAVSKQKNPNISFIGKGSTVPLTDFDPLSEAHFDWKYLQGTIVRFMTDDQQNSGEFKLIDIVKDKLQNTEDGLQDTIEETLFAGAAAGQEFDGLQLLVADDPTTDTAVGSINQLNNPFWRNQASGTHTGVSFATSGVDLMRTMYNNCSKARKRARPDLIMTTQTIHERYEDAVLSPFRIVDKRMSDLGFENISFKGSPVIWSTECTSGRMYFLNTNFLGLTIDPNKEFEMTPWKLIPNQVDDRVAQIATAMAFTVSNRRTQGVMFGLDTA